MRREEITIVASDITADIMKWYVDLGGNIGEDVWYNAKGQRMSTPLVGYGGGVVSHRMQNDSGEYLIRFLGKDEDVALIFLMKFSEYVIAHNMKEEKYVY